MEVIHLTGTLSLICDVIILVAAVLGATSMGVYLLHPLVTRGLSVVITRQIAAPYSASVVGGEWVVAWGISMVAAVLMLRLPVIRRFV